MPNHDFTFAWEDASAPEGPWAHLIVAKLRGAEEMSTPAEYELTLAAKNAAPRVVPAELVGRRCAVRIATLSEPAFKIVHGIVVDAEELDPTEDAHVLRVVMRSPWSRARHQRRCRIFLDKTLRQIVDAVLVGDAGMHRDDGAEVEPDHGGHGYEPASEILAWRIADPGRVDDPRARPYVVQYNESDFAFVSRLLEAEGITYHFEDGHGASVLVLSDTDAGRSRLSPPIVGRATGREVKRFRAAASLRAASVVLADYNWKKPQTEMDAPAGPSGAPLVEYVYPGGYPDAPAQGDPLARARLERHQFEASHAKGEGPLRVLSAGVIVSLGGVAKARHEGEYLVTRLEVEGEQQGVVAASSKTALAGVPFEARFSCARRGTTGDAQESRYRPARTTPRPRIAGAQTALVTADPSASSAEINVGGPDGLSVGCVRLKFHWDTESARLAKEPSSTWVRVSQPFAGVAEGGVWHPRVGVEAIVEFEEGDPDRPIVTGRVYNGANLPPYGGVPTVSTLKSFATPGGAVHNELTFHDSAGGELIYMNAGKDMTTDVGNNRTESVAVDSKMTVGVHNTETIGVNHTLTVGANDTCTIGANDTNVVGANSISAVAANCTLTVGANEQRTIGGAQLITVAGSHTETVGAAVTETYGATHDLTVGAAVTYSVGADRVTTIGGAHTQTYGPHTLSVGGSRQISCPSLTTTVNGIALQMVGGGVESEVGGAYTATAGGGIIYITPEWEVLNSTGADVDANKFDLTILKLEAIGAEAVAAGTVTSHKGVAIDLIGAALNVLGLGMEATGMDVALSGVELHTESTRLEENGLAVFL